MKKEQLFASTDVEADGPVPGLNSMLSFATAVYDINKNLVGTFSRNLALLPLATQNADTMDFWNSTPANKAAYDVTRQDIVDPEDAMVDYVAFLRKLPGTPVFVGYPAVYDFKWVDFYLHAFAGGNPFGFSRCIDVKSYAMAMLKHDNIFKTSKKNFPKRWFDDMPHTHIALDDAKEQGAMFVNIIRENLGLPPIK
jgi:hypothetical protein